jgi:hypothetical protein
LNKAFSKIEKKVSRKGAEAQRKTKEGTENDFLLLSSLRLCVKFNS